MFSDSILATMQQLREVSASSPETRSHHDLPCAFVKLRKAVPGPSQSSPLLVEHQASNRKLKLPTRLVPASDPVRPRSTAVAQPVCQSRRSRRQSSNTNLANAFNRHMASVPHNVSPTVNPSRHKSLTASRHNSLIASRHKSIAAHQKKLESHEGLETRLANQSCQSPKP